MARTVLTYGGGRHPMSTRSMRGAILATFRYSSDWSESRDNVKGGRRDGSAAAGVSHSRPNSSECGHRGLLSFSKIVLSHLLHLSRYLMSVAQCNRDI
jgi:hypothetical protein